MGVEPLEPTFSKFRISPQPGNLEQASIKVPCIRGTITCELLNSENVWQMNVSVPGNTKTEIWIPANFTKVKINGEEVMAKRKVKFAGGLRSVFELNSGIFSISAMK